MKKLRILTLASWYPTDQHPFLGNFVQRHIDALSADHELIVIHPEYRKELHQSGIQESKKGNKTEIRILIPDSKNPIVKWWKTRKILLQLFRQIDPVDLIHGHVSLQRGWTFLLAKNYFHVPLIVSEHASYFREEKRKNWTWKEKQIMRKLLQQVDHWTVPSDVLKKEIQDAFPSIKHLSIVPNVVENIYFETQHKSFYKPVFTHISTLDNQVKNIQGIIDAIEILQAKYPNQFEFRFISDESYNSWQQFTESKGWNEVKFYGPLTSPEIAEHLSETTAIVLNSKYETFSCVLAEAWACSVPTITTSVGIGHQLPEDFGIQIEFDSPLSLSQAMEDFLTKRKQVDSNKMKQKSTEFRAEQIVAQFNHVFNQVI